MLGRSFCPLLGYISGHAVKTRDRCKKCFENSIFTQTQECNWLLEKKISLLPIDCQQTTGPLRLRTFTTQHFAYWVNLCEDFFLLPSICPFDLQAGTCLFICLVVLSLSLSLANWSVNLDLLYLVLYYSNIYLLFYLISFYIVSL